MAETDTFAREYFERSAGSNDEYWQRFGIEPDWRGKRVLDVGCGHGAMSVRIAEAGGQVLGVDLNERRIEYAKRIVAERYPGLRDSVRFEATDATTSLPLEEPFDVIVSKDTFEHVDDLTGLLRGLGRLLTPEGCLYAGFSPLFYSPFGDHGNLGLKLPWAHAALPESLVCALASRRLGRRISSFSDVGLNGKTPAEYRSAFINSGLKIKELHYNRGNKSLLRALDSIRRRSPRLEKFSTVSIYVVFGRGSI